MVSLLPTSTEATGDADASVTVTGISSTLLGRSGRIPVSATEVGTEIAACFAGTFLELKPATAIVRFFPRLETLNMHRNSKIILEIRDKMRETVPHYFED